MSQILLNKPKDRILYSELHFGKQKIQLQSSAVEARCQLCKAGLREGIGLCARRIDGKTILVCSTHNL